MQREEETESEKEREGGRKDGMEGRKEGGKERHYMENLHSAHQTGVLCNNDHSPGSTRPMPSVSNYFLLF